MNLKTAIKRKDAKQVEERKGKTQKPIHTIWVIVNCTLSL